MAKNTVNERLLARCDTVHDFMGLPAFTMGISHARCTKFKKAADQPVVMNQILNANCGLQFDTVTQGTEEQKTLTNYIINPTKTNAPSNPPNGARDFEDVTRYVFDTYLAHDFTDPLLELTDVWTSDKVLLDFFPGKGHIGVMLDYLPDEKKGRQFFQYSLDNMSKKDTNRKFIYLDSISSAWDMATKVKTNRVNISLKATELKIGNADAVKFTSSSEFIDTINANDAAIPELWAATRMLRFGVTSLCQTVTQLGNINNGIWWNANDNVVANVNAIFEDMWKGDTKNVNDIAVIKNAFQPATDKQDENDDVPLFFDVKRSMDYGQVYFVKHLNELIATKALSSNIRVNTLEIGEKRTSKLVNVQSKQSKYTPVFDNVDKVVLITGDRLCYMKCKLAGVPAMLMKNNGKMDLFYGVAPINEERKRLTDVRINYYQEAATGILAKIPNLSRNLAVVPESIGEPVQVGKFDLFKDPVYSLGLQLQAKYNEFKAIVTGFKTTLVKYINQFNVTNIPVVPGDYDVIKWKQYYEDIVKHSYKSQVVTQFKTNPENIIEDTFVLKEYNKSGEKWGIAFTDYKLKQSAITLLKAIDIDPDLFDECINTMMNKTLLEIAKELEGKQLINNTKTTELFSPKVISHINVPVKKFLPKTYNFCKKNGEVTGRNAALETFLHTECMNLLVSYLDMKMHEIDLVTSKLLPQDGGCREGEKECNSESSSKPESSGKSSQTQTGRNCKRPRSEKTETKFNTWVGTTPTTGTQEYLPASMELDEANSSEHCDLHVEDLPDYIRGQLFNVFQSKWWLPGAMDELVSAAILYCLKNTEKSYDTNVKNFIIGVKILQKVDQTDEAEVDEFDFKKLKYVGCDDALIALAGGRRHRKSASSFLKAPVKATKNTPVAIEKKKKQQSRGKCRRILLSKKT